MSYRRQAAQEEQGRTEARRLFREELQRHKRREFLRLCFTVPLRCFLWVAYFFSVGCRHYSRITACDTTSRYLTDGAGAAMMLELLAPVIARFAAGRLTKKVDSKKARYVGPILFFGMTAILIVIAELLLTMSIYTHNHWEELYSYG